MFYLGHRMHYKRNVSVVILCDILGNKVDSKYVTIDFVIFICARQITTVEKVL
jgi:hypothetical protein